MKPRGYSRAVWVVQLLTGEIRDGLWGPRTRRRVATVWRHLRWVVLGLVMGRILGTLLW